MTVEEMRIRQQVAEEVRNAVIGPVGEELARAIRDTSIRGSRFELVTKKQARRVMTESLKESRPVIEGVIDAVIAEERERGATIVEKMLNPETDSLFVQGLRLWLADAIRNGVSVEDRTSISRKSKGA